MILLYFWRFYWIHLRLLNAFNLIICWFWLLFWFFLRIKFLIFIIILSSKVPWFLFFDCLELILRLAFLIIDLLFRKVLGFDLLICELGKTVILSNSFQFYQLLSNWFPLFYTINEVLNKFLAELILFWTAFQTCRKLWVKWTDLLKSIFILYVFNTEGSVFKNF